jgi:hypothetical protein
MPHEPPCLLRRPWYCLGSEDDEDGALRSGGGIRHERIEEPGNSTGGDGRRPRPGAARGEMGKEAKRFGERTEESGFGHLKRNKKKKRTLPHNQTVKRNRAS